jgi:NADH-quinone oxidoreductase subunit J
MNGEVVVFWISAVFAVIGALGLVVSRKAVHSALWVAFTMINVAILYFSLEAPFLGTTQIVVYTGAVMMLFLFVLMIVGVDSSDSLLETIKGQRILAILFALALQPLLFVTMVWKQQTWITAATFKALRT